MTCLCVFKFQIMRVRCVCWLLQVYGLHANADISKNQQETNQLLDSLLASQGSGGGSSGGGPSSGGSRESILLQVASELDGKLRKPFDIEAAQYK
jgi:dynein heavy chain